MTQYMLSVWQRGEYPEPSSEEMQQAYADVDRFNQELQSAGKWVFGGGLHEKSSATVVDATGAEPILTDGPFSEAKEQLGGFWIVEAADLDEALELAKRGSAACKGEVEVRPFQDEPEA